MKIRIGIIGLGRMGGLHALKIKYRMPGNVKLAAVCDIDPNKIDKAKKAFKNVNLFNDYKELIDSGLADAVQIATPHYSHPEIAKYALTRRIHTLVEKPAAVYTLAVREMIETADQNPEIKFGIMFNQRTNPSFIKAKKLIDSGELGGIKRVVWIITDWYRPQSYYDQSSWRGTWQGEGGGVLINQAPHQLDLLQWLCGMPVSIKSFVKYGINRKINVENDVTAYMKLQNGADCVFITSAHDFPGSNRLEITCDKGTILIEKDRITVYKLKYSEKEFSDDGMKGNIPYTKHAERIHPLKKPYGFLVGQHTKIIKNFADSIMFGAKLIADGREGINELMISNAILMSDWLGSAVSLPIDEVKFLEMLKERF